MRTVWSRFFGSAIPFANDSSGRVGFPRSDSDEAASSELTPSDQHSDIEPGGAADGANSVDSVANSFDSIGQRNEALRNQLDSVEIAFRNVEQIRTHFRSILGPIDEMLRDFERTKASLHDVTLKLATLTEAHARLAQEHTSVVSERDALIEQRDNLDRESRETGQSLRNFEATLEEAKRTIDEQASKIDRLDRDLETASRRIPELCEEIEALQTTLEVREKVLMDTEQRRAALFDQHNMAQQEDRALRTRIEEQSKQLFRATRQLAELETRHAEASRRAGELEGALAVESAAVVTLRNQYQAEMDDHRASFAALQVNLSATGARAAAAERLLGEARQELREQLSEVRQLQRQQLDSASAAKAQEKRYAELDRDHSAARSQLAELEASSIMLADRFGALTKEHRNREAALQRAEEKTDVLEARVSELTNALQSQRAQHEAKTTQLSERIEAEAMARALAEGALQTARRDRMSLQRELANLKDGMVAKAVETPPAQDGETESTVPAAPRSIDVTRLLL